MNMQDNNHLSDRDPIETQEWLEALESVIREEGTDRALFILRQVLDYAGKNGVQVGASRNTAYVNTIAPESQGQFPGNEELEERITALMRWNAIAMVLRAGKKAPELGGHLATYASSASLYE